MQEFKSFKNREEKVDLQDHLLRIRKKAEKKLLKIPNVVHVGVAIKQKGGESTDIPCLRVYVRKKLPLVSIPKKEVIPSEIEGIPTDVIEIAETKFQEDTAKYRPVVGGCQIMNTKWKTVTTSSGQPGFEVSYGTLGCLVTRNSDNKVGFISAHHVLAYGGATTNDLIGQPRSPCESLCCSCGDIAKITNLVDDQSFVECGFALLNEDVPYTNSIVSIGYIRGTAVPVLHEEVRKYGRTTNLTTGTVDDISGASIVDGVTYTDQVIVVPKVAGTPFTQAGDSGSVYVNGDNKVIALHSNGNGTTSVGNKIARVEDALGVTVLATVAPVGVTPMGGYLTDEQPVPVLADEIFEWEQQLLSSNRDPEQAYRIMGARNEITHLLRHNREVKVAWNRYQGPAFAAHLGKAMREKGYCVPSHIKGISWKNLMIKMSVVLETHGSRTLQQLIDRHAADLLQLDPDPKKIKDYLVHHITPESLSQ